jgi:hypothetical protein
MIEYDEYVNGGISNHTHQISNLRVNDNNNNNTPIQLSPRAYLSQAFQMFEQMARRRGIMYIP